ncbi:hypothetical protein DFH09DRAFT_1499590 [Mycena vulgaris]|nr:hypothetical protein DFH09DRAFT_1499590 [Mycena vulgaris]
MYASPQDSVGSKGDVAESVRLVEGFGSEEFRRQDLMNIEGSMRRTARHSMLLILPSPTTFAVASTTRSASPCISEPVAHTRASPTTAKPQRTLRRAHPRDRAVTPTPRSRATKGASPRHPPPPRRTNDPDIGLDAGTTQEERPHHTRGTDRGAAMNAPKRRMMRLEQRAETLVVEGVAARRDEERLADRDGEEAWGKAKEGAIAARGGANQLALPAEFKFGWINLP